MCKTVFVRLYMKWCIDCHNAAGSRLVFQQMRFLQVSISAYHRTLVYCNYSGIKGPLVTLLTQEPEK